MSWAYYNEIDDIAAQWLRNLIAAGHIAPGFVDQRSIEDVRPDELGGFTQCHFFAGIGVWSYALRRAGWADSSPIWTGSCPCQPFSQAGKGAGFDDQRHLWPAWHYLIIQREPNDVIGEQVASRDGLEWFDLVHSDMEAAGYSGGAHDLCAAGFGAPNIRQRLWMAYALDERHQGHADGTEPGGGHVTAKRGKVSGIWERSDWLRCADGKQRPIESGIIPISFGTPEGMGRLRAYGNAINVEAATEFIKSLYGR